MRCAALALAAFAATTPALAGPPSVARPVTPWEASSEGGVCRMQRSFEADGQPHLLIMEQNAPGRALGVAMAGSSLGALDPDAPLRVSFAANHAGFDKPARIEPNRQFGHVAILNGVWLMIGAASDDAAGNGGDHSRIDAAEAQKVDRIAIAQGDSAVTFETGALGDAAAVLNACTAQILKGWGLDPEVQYSLQRGVSAEGLKFTYPRIASRYLRSGPVDAVALIDATGKATGCRIISSSGHDELDQSACQGMTKPRYRAALDAFGKPVASYWKTRITYAATDFEAQQRKP